MNESPFCDRIILSLIKRNGTQPLVETYETLKWIYWESILSTRVQDSIFKCIQTEFKRGFLVTYDLLLDWLYGVHHISFLLDNLRHLIRRTVEFKTILEILMENSRCLVNQEEITQHFEDLAKLTENVPAAFILTQSSLTSRTSSMLMRYMSLFLPTMNGSISLFHLTEQKRETHC
jgi:hypothetical protein